MRCKLRYELDILMWKFTSYFNQPPKLGNEGNKGEEMPIIQINKNQTRQNGALVMKCVPRWIVALMFSLIEIWWRSDNVSDVSLLLQTNLVSYSASFTSYVASSLIQQTQQTPQSPSHNRSIDGWSSISVNTRQIAPGDANPTLERHQNRCDFFSKDVHLTEIRRCTHDARRM
jgi:hypothetical protein